MKERRDMRERVLGSTMIAMLAEKYFTLVLPRMKDCVSQAGYDLALCEQEEVLPFVKEAEPSLDPSSLNALIHALHEKLLKEGLLEPPKRKEFPVDEDETVV
jgi:hypothetical protein